MVPFRWLAGKRQNRCGYGTHRYQLKKKVDNFFWTVTGNRALSGPCFFPSLIQGGDGRKKTIFKSDEGTLEFWLKPRWRASWLPPYSKCDLQDETNHYFISMGPINSGKLYFSDFKAILAVNYSGKYRNLGYFIGKEVNVKWRVSYSLKNDRNWPGERWHHIACVWNANDSRENWMRLYVDGKKITWSGKLDKEERLKGKPQIDLKPRVPYSVQVGAKNNGWYFADALIDELRISRIARYKEDFTPSGQEFKLDDKTSVLFHFNDSLNGEGMDADGKHYTVPATAGIVGW